jgi:hypothetical protein
MITYLEDTQTYESWDGTEWIRIVSESTGNAIINGAFEINQRNFTSSTVLSHGFDRWIYAPSGATGTYSSESFTLGAAPVAGYESRNFARVSVSTGNDFARLVNRIESVRTFAGQTVTLSFWAKGTNPATLGKLSAGFEQFFGTGGSPSASITGPENDVVLTANWVRYSFTMEIPSIAGKTLGTNNDNYLAINVGQLSNASTDSWTLDIWGVQLEAGSVATPFRRNANSLQGELAACQRYFEAVQSFNVAGTAASTSTALFNCYLKVRKRTNPTIGFRSTTYAFDQTGLGSKTGTAQAAQIASIDLCIWNVSGSSGLTLGQHLSWNGGNVEFSSEL